MRFFKRGGHTDGPAADAGPEHAGEATGDGGTPDWATNALAAAGIKAELRRSPYGGTRFEAWAVTVPGERALEAWDALRSRRDPGWWPVIVGAPEDEARVGEMTEYTEAAVATILDAAARLDVERELASRRAELDETYEEDPDEPSADLVGEWPADSAPSTTFALPLDIRTRRPRPTAIVLVPAATAAEVAAVVGFGSWNECPAPELHVALHRRWQERYGAELVGLSADTLEMRVTRPPRTREEAMVLAGEQYAYCDDIVHQGTENLSNLAAVLLDGTAWFFWWD